MCIYVTVNVLLHNLSLASELRTVQKVRLLFACIVLVHVLFVILSCRCCDVVVVEMVIAVVARVLVQGYCLGHADVDVRACAHSCAYMRVVCCACVVCRT